MNGATPSDSIHTPATLPIGVGAAGALYGFVMALVALLTSYQQRDSQPWKDSQESARQFWGNYCWEVHWTEPRPTPETDGLEFPRIDLHADGTMAVCLLRMEGGTAWSTGNQWESSAHRLLLVFNGCSFRITPLSWDGVRVKCRATWCRPAGWRDDRLIVLERL